MSTDLYAQPAADAHTMAVAYAAVRSAADVREERIAMIKRRVASGTYAVPARVLARKMIAFAI